VALTAALAVHARAILAARGPGQTLLARLARAARTCSPAGHLLRRNFFPVMS